MASFLKVIGTITIIIGIVVALVLISSFSKPGMFSRSGLEAKEIVLSVAVAYYHLVFGALCLGVANIFGSKDIEKSGESGSMEPQ